MKKLYLLTLFLLPSLIFAQLEVDTDWKTEINNIFQYLDKSKVTSGHLLDYAMEFTDITAYDGVVRDTNYVDLNVVGNIYKTLYMAKTSTDTTHTPQYQKFAYDIAQHVYQKNLMEKNNIVLSGLLFEYQHLDTLALGQNRIRVINNRYYDKYTNRVWQNPYKTKRTMAVAPSTNQSSSSTLKFMLPSDLLLSNISGQITSIEMNFDNRQGWQTITLDQYLTVNFTQNRVHDFTTRINLTNGQQMLSRTKFKIDDPDMYSVPIKSTMLSAPNKIRISEGVPFTSSYIGADLTIRRMTSGQITKPLIVVEGFDSGHITDPADEDGDRGINSFISDLRTSFAGNNLNNLLTGSTQQYDIIYVDWIKGTASMEDNSRILKQVIEWVNNEKTVPEPNVILGQSMGGVISRYTLAKWEQEDPNFNPDDASNTSPHDVRLFIAHDSPMQGANTPLSIQHFTRHVKLQYVQTPLALATGEVLLPIAFNLAESVSDFINWFGANTSVDPYVSPLANLGIQDTPAARELNYWSLETWNHTQTQDYYDDWQSELSSVGYPLASRNVAISNGNECAEDHGFNPGDLLFKIDDVDNPDFFGDLLNMIGVPLLNVTRPLDFGLAIVGAIPGSSKWRYNFDFYATPLQGTQNQIYRGRIRYEKRVLWIGPKIEYDLTNRTFDSPSSALPYDSYAGGYVDVNPFVCSFIDGQTVCEPDFIIDLPSQVPSVEISHRHYGFIPTVSALDIVKTNGNNPDPIDYLKTTSGGVIQDNNLVSNFDSFAVDYSQNNRGNDTTDPSNPANYLNFNNEHISFQVRNGNWLADELQAQNPADYPVVEDCSFICGGESSFTGVSQFCTGSQTYSVPSGADSYSWQAYTDPIPLTDNPVTGNVSITSSTNTNSITLTHTGNMSTWITISVVINSAKCDIQDLTFTKRVYVGAPNVNFISVEEDPNGAHQNGNAGINSSEIPLRLNFEPNNNSVTEIEWEKITTDVDWSRDFLNYPGHYVYLFPTCNKDFKFKVRAKNNCGFWSPWRELSYTITECSTNCSSGGDGPTTDNFYLYPLPSNNSINIEVVNEPTWYFPEPLTPIGSSPPNTYTNPNIPLSVAIYNSNSGVLVYSSSITGLPNLVDVSNILPGNYTMHIQYQGQTEIRNIIIN